MRFSERRRTLLMYLPMLLFTWLGASAASLASQRRRPIGLADFLIICILCPGRMSRRERFTMSKLILGLSCGVLFGLLSVGLMLPTKFTETPEPSD